MGKLRTGQKLIGIPSRDWNRFVDTAEVVERSLGPAGGGLEFAQPGSVLVKNTSGAVANRFRALGIDGVEVEPADDLTTFKDDFILTGDTPATGDNVGKYCVLQEDLADDDVGIALIHGVSVVELDVPGTDYGQRFVDITNATTLLTESWYGAAEIVAGPWTDDSKRWAMVRLGIFQSPIYQAIVTESGGIAANGSGDCEIQVAGVAKETVTGHLKWMEGTTTAAENDECLVRFDRDYQRWQIDALEC